MTSDSVVALKGITIAVVNVEAMVAFYNAVFDAQLEAFEGFGTTLYGGQLAGLPFLLCPNEILGIEADKNRIQLSFAVDDLDEMLAVMDAYGGAQIQPISEQPGRRLCGIVDPDGNTIELEELTA
jgi:predicted enzyme related to lactoylglutathione lyase